MILIAANTVYSRIAESKVIQRTQRNLTQAAGYLSLLICLLYTSDAADE